MISDINFQFLGSKQFLSPSSLMFSYDSNKCLINVGENIQRYCFEHKVRLSRLRCILLTHISVETIGGLPGLLLTLNGIGLNKLKIFGPEPLTEYLLLFGYKIKNQEKKEDSLITKISINSNDFLDDHNQEKSEVEIEIVEFSQSYFEFSKPFTIDLGYNIKIDCYLINDNYEYKYNDQNYPSKKRIIDLVNNNSKSSVLYYFEFPDKRGKFDIFKAKKLGIPPGPLYSKLKNGETINLDNSKLIFPEDVCSPPIKIPWTIVLNTSNEIQDELFYSILNELLFSKNYSIDSNIIDESNNLCNFYIFHFNKYNLINSKLNQIQNNFVKYQNLLKGQLKIIKMNDFIYNLKDSEINPFQTSYYLQEFLNSICPEIFPQRLLINDEYYWNKQFIISPNKKIINNNNSSNNINKKKYKFSNNTTESINKSEILKTNFSKIFSKSNNLIEIQYNNFPLLYVLGTGSAIPSPYRNVSGNLLYIDNNNSLLLDCGEGSMFQLFALSNFDIKTFYKHIYNIKIVFISHPHEDHFLGLFQLIQIKYSQEFFEINNIQLEYKKHYFQYENGIFYFNNDFKNQNNDLIIIGPNNIEKIFNIYLNKIIIKEKNEKNYMNIYFKSIEKTNFEKIKFDLNNNDSYLKLEPFPVKHIKFSYGIRITINQNEINNENPFILVFSGDTIPCSSIEEASKNCDILIHEATFDDSLIADAYKKNHSTISGAIKTAFKSSSKILLLTHFSQRYFSAPNVQLEDKTLNDFFLNCTLFMMDLMIIPLKNTKTIVPNLHILNNLIRDYLPQV